MLRGAACCALRRTQALTPSILELVAARRGHFKLESGHHSALWLDVLPPALAAGVHGKRMAIVDDVMSAGSALRGTTSELAAHGATTTVAGALLVLGTVGADYFALRDVPVVAVAREAYELWSPAECPMCADKMAIEDVGST